ncbi:MAG: chemotaxis-specific protein-glutamate methyltransferase CheB [bacterium]
MTDADLIRVLVVDDSAFNRRTISEILETSGAAKVVGVARDGEEGIKKAFETRPDLITLDLEMPRMDGFTFLRIVMKSLPTPILVISSRSEDKNVFRALELGAIDFLAKPSSHLQTSQVLRQELLEKLKVVEELKMRNLQRQVNRAASPEMGLTPEKLAEVKPAAVETPASALVMGASTGGPSALQAIIGSLPGDMGTSILISQHMPTGFTRAFAERLDRNSAFRVKEAEDKDVVEPGTVLLAPGGRSLRVEKEKDRVLAVLEDHVEGEKYVPSVNALFSSAAEVFAQRCMGVVLTGMGNDGSEGVRRIKEAGGYVIAESEQTSIVFGMPREAIATNMVDEVLNLDDIAVGIIKRCKRG